MCGHVGGTREGGAVEGCAVHADELDLGVHRPAADRFVLDVSERYVMVLMHTDCPGVWVCHRAVIGDTPGVLTSSRESEAMSQLNSGRNTLHIYNLSRVFYLACTPLHNRRINHDRPLSFRSPYPCP